MNITEIRATIKYSRQLPDGSHKTIELGATAEADQNTPWNFQQADLYRDLTNQLRTLWAQNGTPTEAHSAGPAPSTDTRANPCQQCNGEYQRHEKNGQVWYSHRAADGTWHRKPA